MQYRFSSFAVAGGLLAALATGALAAPRLSAPGGGVVRALVVGINNYHNLPPGAQLHGAVEDARDIAGALEKVGVPTRPILDREATRERLVKELNRLVAELKSGDFVIISFAGHGMQVPEYPKFAGIEEHGVNEQIALAGFEFRGEGVGDVLVNKELKAFASRLDEKGVDVLIVMDSCFGGGMSRKVDPRAGAWTVRRVSGSASPADLQKFVPIAMTDREKRVPDAFVVARHLSRRRDLGHRGAGNLRSRPRASGSPRRAQFLRRARDRRRGAGERRRIAQGAVHLCATEGQRKQRTASGDRIRAAGARRKEF